MLTVADFLDRLDAVTSRRGGGWTARCPAHHPDRHPSLKVDERPDGGALPHCFTGCTTAEIVAAMGLDWGDVFGRRDGGRSSAAPPIAYVYEDADGNPYRRVVRGRGADGRKTFRIEHWNGTAWASRAGNTTRVLYHLPDVIATARAGGEIWIAEGEKDVDRLRAAFAADGADDIAVTCNDMGAGKWTAADIELTAPLRGARLVVIVADADTPGRKHARQVAAACTAAGIPRVRIVEAAEGKDASDHLNAGRGLHEFVGADITIDEPRPAATSSGPRAAVDGETFLFGAVDDDGAVVWGTPGEAVWMSGEPFALVGPQGVGKTTVGCQIVAAWIGILPPGVIGWPFHGDDRPVLYIAADRPRQVRRAMRRLVRPEHRALVRDRLRVWEGPPPFDFALAPAADVAAWIAEQGDDPGLVIIDSAKDVTVGLAKDEVGAAMNRVFQHVVADRRELVVLHHQRKAQQGAARPRTLDDVYGSNWLTAGCGSVVLLWGDPGDPIVDLIHLKAPRDAVGPLKVIHDHDHGMSTVWDQTNVVALAHAHGGVTARAAAIAIYGKDAPSDADIERARRALDKAVKRGDLWRDDEAEPHTWHPTGPRPAGGHARPTFDDLQKLPTDAADAHDPASLRPTQHPTHPTHPDPTIPGGSKDPRDVVVNGDDPATDRIRAAACAAAFDAAWRPYTTPDGTEVGGGDAWMAYLADAPVDELRRVIDHLALGDPADDPDPFTGTEPEEPHA